MKPNILIRNPVHSKETQKSKIEAKLSDIKPNYCI